MKRILHFKDFLTFYLKAMIQTITNAMVDGCVIVGKMYYGFVKELPWLDRLIGISILYSGVFLIFYGLKLLKFK